jgi:hypothetical protein
MKVMQFWRRAVQTDLQDDSITRQCSQAFCAPAAKQHSVGQYCRRSGGSASRQNLVDIFQQKRLAAGHEDLVHAKLRCFVSDPLNPREA